MKILYPAEGYPAQNLDKSCISCMHCVAICRHEAIQFESTPSISIATTKVSAEDSHVLENCVINRRSVRNYTNQNVPENVLHHVLDTVEWAPSAKNQHPVKWIVINSKDKIDSIMNLVLTWVEENEVHQEILSEFKNGNNVVICNAPTILISYGSISAINPYTDCTIALTTAELLLYSKGISTCWAGYLTSISNASSDILNLIGIPEGNKIYGILLMGYSDREDYHSIPFRKKAEIHWQ